MSPPRSARSRGVRGDVRVMALPSPPRSSGTPKRGQGSDAKAVVAVPGTPPASGEKKTDVTAGSRGVSGAAPPPHRIPVTPVRLPITGAFGSPTKAGPGRKDTTPPLTPSHVDVTDALRAGAETPPEVPADSADSHAVPVDKFITEVCRSTLHGGPCASENVRAMSQEDILVERWKLVATYYKAWEPPPSRKDRVKFLETMVMKNLEYDELKKSLGLRRECLL